MAIENMLDELRGELRKLVDDMQAWVKSSDLTISGRQRLSRSAERLEQLLEQLARSRSAPETTRLDEVERRLDRVAEKARKIHDECDD
jgi:hypothetical protein